MARRWGARSGNCAPSKGNGGAIPVSSKNPAPPLVFWMINHFDLPLKNGAARTVLVHHCAQPIAL
jgi:hypothetical protein